MKLLLMTPIFFEFRCKATMFKMLIRDGVEVLLSISQVPTDDILESVFQMRTRESDQLKTVLAMCKPEIDQHLSKPNYQKLKTMLKRQKDQKIRVRSFKPETKELKQECWFGQQKGEECQR